MGKQHLIPVVSISIYLTKMLWWEIKYTGVHNLGISGFMFLGYCGEEKLLYLYLNECDPV